MASATDAEALAAAARAAVDRLFAQAKLRLGVTRAATGARQLVVSANPHLSLPGLYEAAAKEHGTTARAGAVEEVRRSAAGFLEAQKEAAQAAVGRAVHHIARRLEGPLDEDTRAELESAVGSILERTAGAVERVVDTEASAARNLSGVEAASAVSLASGIEDPRVFWWVTHRNTCKECYAIHTLDGVTPRVWLLSEVSAAYHVRGEDKPSLLGLHPHCECTQTFLLKGWGFDQRGGLKFIGVGHDELARQRGF